ncbi:hypothetical protein PHPALM_15811 [Phytophthora palmivora]|uniref:Uncharacterized protein n=1 Tax=Phytophthora palmivora TaxID=4796 RepID=A0A2P4XR94_9STRA|nr:hypothetical protein PHPALM_15811 [Phytophthora palmivora]
MRWDSDSKGNGYANLLNHLQRDHKGNEQEGQEADCRRNPLNLRLVCQRTRDLYRWPVNDL